MALPKKSLWPLLLAELALFMAAGCGGGETAKEYGFTRGEGHFRGVIYATASPAPGENPIYTVDFTQPGEGGAIIKAVSTYQSTAEATGGQIDGIFGYSNNGTFPVENLIFSETYYKNLPTPTPDHATTYHSFYQLFGPPTNNGTHFDGILIESVINVEATDGPRHKAIFDKIP